jgi:hypothetical protein
MPGPTSPSAAATNDAAAGRLGLRVLSVIPPMTQLNTPYPSTAYLTGFLRSRGFDARQCDLALGLVLALLSRPGLEAVRAELLLVPAKGRSARATWPRCT